jgi:hypothetical protein
LQFVSEIKELQDKSRSLTTMTQSRVPFERDKSFRENHKGGEKRAGKKEGDVVFATRAKG